MFPKRLFNIIGLGVSDMPFSGDSVNVRCTENDINIPRYWHTDSHCRYLTVINDPALISPNFARALGLVSYLREEKYSIKGTQENCPSF
jgi:hypothetical protein